MSRSLTFVYLDGREIQGATPREVLEALRAGESASPIDLGRYHDLIYTRAALTGLLAARAAHRYDGGSEGASGRGVDAAPDDRPSAGPVLPSGVPPEAGCPI